MIDIENEVFNTVTNALRAIYGDAISVYGIYVEAPEKFPSVSLVEDDNVEVTENVTLTREPETTSTVMYTANAYSNLASGKKDQAKDIMDIIDRCMHQYGFVRTMRSQLPNVDRTIYRVTARYTKVIQIID